VLKTLENYIEEAPQGWLLEPRLDEIKRDSRLVKIIAASVVSHVALFALLIQLDTRAGFTFQKPQPPPTEYVKIVELAAPDEQTGLRSTREHTEKPDLSHLHYDPKNSNDENLIARSPKPTTAKGNDGTLPSAAQIEKQANPIHSANREPAPTPASSQPASILNPPDVSQVPPTRVPQINAPAVTPLPQTPSPAPPAPKSTATVASPPSASQAGTRTGDASETRKLGIQEIEAQYKALVRARIKRANERIMPRDWVEGVLTDKVSADFELVIRRNGQISSVRLFRSSGYAKLDDIARQAIYIANPFDGYPQDAGEAITLTVTVYYAPGR